MPPIESFPELLKTYRRRNGWTQEELAKHWFYSSDAISAWERGIRNPRSQQIPRIAGLLGMTSEELIRRINIIADEENTHTDQESFTDEMRRVFGSALETWGELQHIYQNRTEFSRKARFKRA